MENWESIILNTPLTQLQKQIVIINGFLTNSIKKDPYRNLGLWFW